MTRKRRYRWHWRVAMALVSFSAVFTFTLLVRPHQYVQHALLVLAEASGILSTTPSASMGSPVAGWRSFPLAEVWLLNLITGMGMAIAFLPNLWVALFVYDRLTFAAKWLDGHTYCGFCGTELQELREPKCPNCGAPLSRAHLSHLLHITGHACSGL